MTWGDKYTKDLKNINIIVISRNTSEKDSNNVFYCKSVEDCLELCKKKTSTIYLFLVVQLQTICLWKKI